MTDWLVPLEHSFRRHQTEFQQNANTTLLHLHDEMYTTVFLYQWLGHIHTTLYCSINLRQLKLNLNLFNKALKTLPMLALVIILVYNYICKQASIHLFNI